MMEYNFKAGDPFPVDLKIDPDIKDDMDIMRAEAFMYGVTFSEYLLYKIYDTVSNKTMDVRVENDEY